MIQLSNLITKFSTKILEQEQITETIMDDANISNLLIKEANVQLDQAKDLVNEYSRIWIAIFLILAFLILFFDWIKM